MIRLQELSSYLDDYLELSLFQDYGPNGIQIEGKEEIKKIGVAVTASLETIEKAISLGCDALIVHHGLFWKGDPYPLTGAKKKRVQLLLANHVSLLAYHLPLDAHQGVGNNWVAARALGFSELEKFDVGVRGVFPAVSFETFLKKLKGYYGRDAVVAPFGKKRVKSATLISGGAYKYMAQAKSDVFITGNYDEPAWWMAQEAGMHFVAMGHFATEKIGPQALAAHVQQACGVKALFIDVENPF